MPSPRGRKGPKTTPKILPKKKNPPSAPGHSIGQLPLEQQRTINHARHTATLQRLERELRQCYRMSPNGKKILWKKDDAAAIRRQIASIQQLLEESQ